MVHCPGPLHVPPLQPMNVLPAAGVAVRVTCAPWLSCATQSPLATPAVAVQLTTFGTEVTVPFPVPPAPTVSWRATKVKLAVTARSLVIVSEHVVPVQAPVHPTKVLPKAGVAVSVTVAPCVNAREHVPLTVPAALVHPTPAGVDETLPLPGPAPPTVSVFARSVTVYCTGISAGTKPRF